jgi:3-phenylpropionate/cinnamic acid dioxygenase small subunit
VTESATAISNLIARYAELIDLGDFDGVADLLGDAAVGDGKAGDAHGGSPPLLTGRDAILAMFTSTTRRYPDGTPGTKHVTTNLILDVDDEAGQAAARSYWTVLQAVPGLPLQPILAGRYHDRFTRSASTWRFAERRYLIDLVGDVSRHMLSNIPS